jgi:hypothetical protein
MDKLMYAFGHDEYLYQLLVSVRPQRSKPFIYSRVICILCDIYVHICASMRIWFHDRLRTAVLFPRKP